MFAKLFRKSDVFKPADLEALPSLEPGEQLALLDQYLSFCKEHEHSESNAEAIHELLSDLSDDAIKSAGLCLEVAKRAVSATQDIAALEALLDKPNMGELAAKRLCKLLPLDSTHEVNQHERLFSARLQGAQAVDIKTLSKRVTTAEQASWLVVRAPAEARQELLSMPLLQDEAGLLTLEKVSRGKDKGCNRLARERLDTIRRCKRLLSEHLDTLSDIHASALRELKIDPKDLDGLIVQRKKLNQLHSRHEQLVQDIGKARGALQTTAALEQPVQPIDNPFEQIDLSIPSSQDNPYLGLITSMQDLLDKLATEEDIDAATLAQHDQTLTSSQQAWSVAESNFPPSASQQGKFTALEKTVCETIRGRRQLAAIDWPALDSAKQSSATRSSTTSETSLAKNSTVQDVANWLTLARQVEQSVQWPSATPVAIPVPTALQRLRQEIEQAISNKRELIDQQQTLSKELQMVGATLQGFIDNGEFKKALGELSRCRKLQKRGAKGSEKLLNSISAQLQELSDWQQYAASPKREALLQAIDAMVSTPLAADLQRAKIKELRTQWNALGPLPKEQLHLQRQFDELAEQAFEICREHFAHQNKQRKDNLLARKALCDQLQQYLDNTDWQLADMKAAEHIMRQARQEWRKHHPCDRKALKPVEERFEILQSVLHDHVKRTWDRNIDAKEALVSAAQELQAQDSSAGLAAAAKQLQAQWRDTGTTPRGADQRLWKKFREACDGIFARLEQERASQRSAQDEQLQQLIQDIAAFDPAHQSIAETETALAALNHRAREVRLNAAHLAALKEFEQQLRARRAQAQQANQAKRLATFRGWDEDVSKAEQSGDTITSPHASFKARVAGTANAENLLALTIAAEIAADIAGPADEQSTRMALQVELMNRGMRNMQLIDNQQLLERWCSSGPKTAEDNALRERFFSALNKRLG